MCHLFYWVFLHLIYYNIPYNKMHYFSFLKPHIHLFLGFFLTTLWFFKLHLKTINSRNKYHTPQSSFETSCISLVPPSIHSMMKDSWNQNETPQTTETAVDKETKKYTPPLEDIPPRFRISAMNVESVVSDPDSSHFRIVKQIICNIFQKTYRKDQYWLQPRYRLQKLGSPQI